MKYILIKKWLKEKYVYLLAVLPILAFILYKMFVKRKVEVTNTAAVELQKKLTVVRVEAALEIGKARGKELAVKEEVSKIIEMPTNTKEEQRKQLQDLADLINRTRRN